MRRKTRDITAEEADRYLYRRQFILGPRPAGELRHWSCTAVGRGFTLQAHPDLTVTQVAGGAFQLTLLGDMVDPEKPQLENQAVLTDLLSALGRSEPGRATAGYGGRWVLIFDDGKSTLILHDACGLRQVFHCRPSSEGSWCASQPERIAEVLDLKLDPVARDRFLGSPYVARDPEYWWPGDATPYAEVRRLLPNHDLNLRTGQVHRYWPRARLEEVTPEEALEIVPRLLRGLLDGASRRFPLALPITAGFDSRTLLAAAREFVANVFCYTLRFDGMPRTHRDLIVPRKLMAQLQLEYRVIECPSSMSGRFRDVYQRSSNPAHERAGAIAQGLIGKFPDGHVCLSGHASEIARCAFYDTVDLYPASLDAELLAAASSTGVGSRGSLRGMGDNEFAVAQFGRWLSGALEVEREYGVKVLDLFYWEQRVAGWAANGQAQWDIVHDRFPPYACRDLLTTLLGVDVTWREFPDFRLYQEIIRVLWPDLLRQPFNPKTSRSPWAFIRQALFPSRVMCF